MVLGVLCISGKPPCLCSFAVVRGPSACCKCGYGHFVRQMFDELQLRVTAVEIIFIQPCEKCSQWHKFQTVIEFLIIDPANCVKYTDMRKFFFPISLFLSKGIIIIFFLLDKHHPSRFFSAPTKCGIQTGNPPITLMCCRLLWPDSLRMGDIWKRDITLQLKQNLHNLIQSGPRVTQFTKCVYSEFRAMTLMT